MRGYRISASLACLAIALAGTQVRAQDAASTEQGPSVGDIIVTAQKRAQSINTVGMSINAITGDALVQRGVVDSADLVKLVPGFTYAQSAYTTPVYTLRGVGLYDAGLSSAPAVTVYVDEIPLPYAVMTRGAALDLERVEVLKGPQGTLFGQNSTGGAINYIAAKPTDEFVAGGSLSYARFGEIDVQGYVGGQLAPGLTARLAVRTDQGGAWQKSISRPEDERGATRLTVARLLLDYDASDSLRFKFNVNGWIDKSDTQAPQLTAVRPGFPALANPALIAAPIIPDKARLAEWSNDWPTQTDDRFWQASMRAELDLSDMVMLTSISAYSDMKADRYNEGDATVTQNLDTRIFGSIKSFNQELRLSGDTDDLTWLLGVNYDHAKVHDAVYFRFPELTLRQPFPFLPPIAQQYADTAHRVNTYSAFGNVEYKLTPNLTLQAGVRYTRTIRKTASCNYDDTPGSAFPPLFNFLASVLNPPGTVVPQLLQGQCQSLDNINGVIQPGITPYLDKLDEDNLSYRAGLTYKFDGGPLLYANYSRGWKAGVISNLSASSTVQFAPAVQERLDAIEVGFKAPLLVGRLQLNGAAFHYDYRNKQIRGRIADPIFGLLEALVNIPRSRVQGFEVELVAQPVTGLNLSGGVTYLNSKINRDFTSFSQEGAATNFRGSRIPYTPQWQAVADAEYGWEISGLRPFIGGSLTYHSSDNATFTTPTAPAPDFALRPYTLIDLRAGFGAEDDSWRVTLFGRNVTNKYYTTTGFNGTDTRYRFAGRPATYGVTVSVKTR